MAQLEALIKKIPTEEKIFRSAKRVNVFKYVDCIKTLAANGFSTEDIKAGMQGLLDEYKIVKVKVSSSDESCVDLESGKKAGIKDLYIWTQEETSYKTLIIGALVLFLFFAGVMFQMWPTWLQIVVLNVLKYVVGGFLVFWLVMWVLKPIIFYITSYTNPPGLYVLPNLHEDCGFFESFDPLYCWGNENYHHPKQ
jgi:translocation protein SEC62